MLIIEAFTPIDALDGGTLFLRSGRLLASGIGFILCPKAILADEDQEEEYAGSKAAESQAS